MHSTEVAATLRGLDIPRSCAVNIVKYIFFSMTSFVKEFFGLPVHTNTVSSLMAWLSISLSICPLIHIQCHVQAVVAFASFGIVSDQTRRVHPCLWCGQILQNLLCMRAQ